jgi:hypothetical protein
MGAATIDLPLDLGSQDDSGLPWGLLSDAPEPALVAAGVWIVVGSPLTCAVAQVVDVTDGVVHVLPLPGAVEDNADLLTRRA